MTRDTYHFDPTKTPFGDRHEGSFDACVKIGCCLFREQLEAELAGLIVVDALLQAPTTHFTADPDTPLELHDGSFADCPGCIDYLAEFTVRSQRNGDPLPRNTPAPYDDPPPRPNGLTEDERAWLEGVRRTVRRRLIGLVVGVGLAALVAARLRGADVELRIVTVGKVREAGLGWGARR